MTLNLVLKAKADHKVDRNGPGITCSEIANRWLTSGVFLNRETAGEGRPA